MKFLKQLFNQNDHPSGFKLQFIKSEATWHVLKGQAIVYIGTKEMCQRYLKHVKV